MEKLLPFLRLDKKISEAFAKREFELCKRKIAIQLEKAEELKSGWNYWNIIHLSYTHLGLIALEENEIEEAKKYLLKSGKIKGSPQSKTAGPNMLLAKKLLEIDEKKIVLEFLDLCKRFWYKVFNFKKIRKWKKEIKKGEIPEFGGNLIYHLDPHKIEKFAKMM